MGRGTGSINASCGGVKRAYGSGCWLLLPLTRIWKTGCLTARWDALIRGRQGPQKRGEQALGRSRGGFSCKIHITVDALGNPLRMRLSVGQPCGLTAGQGHDSTQAQALLDGFDFERLIADRGYAAPKSCGCMMNGFIENGIWWSVLSPAG